MTDIEQLFFELLQVSLDRRKSLRRVVDEEEWQAIFAIAQKQAVAGFAFDALNKIVGEEQRIPRNLLLEWIGISEQIKKRNFLINQRCKELEKVFVDGGYRCCVLKGQGTSLYYQNPFCRQSGDIDIWVEGKRDEIIAFAHRKNVNVEKVDVKHADIAFFTDVPVEVHFKPSWMFSPYTNYKLKQFFKQKANDQFSNYDINSGFTHTTVDFDLVFSLVHIFRHVFFEGIGLRQLLDYYQILLHTNEQQRKDAYKMLAGLGMEAFTGGVMWVLNKCFALEEKYCLCSINERYGKHLLSEILIAGNFGHSDPRFNFNHDKRWVYGFIQLERNILFLRYYPSEVLWSPIWKICHWCWRKWKGYL